MYYNREEVNEKLSRTRFVLLLCSNRILMKSYTDNDRDYNIKGDIFMTKHIK